MRKVYLLGIIALQFVHTELFAQCNLILVPSGNQVLCNGEFSEVVNYVGGTDSGYVYTWTNDDPSIGLAAFGTGPIPRFVAVNLSDVAKTATIKIKKSPITIKDKVFDTSGPGYYKYDEIPPATLFARIIVGGGRGAKVLEGINDTTLVKGGQAAGAAASFLVGPNEFLQVGDILKGHVGKKGIDVWLSGDTQGLGVGGGGGSFVVKGSGPLSPVLVAAGGGGGAYIRRTTVSSVSSTFKLAGGDGGVIVENGLPIGDSAQLVPDPGGSEGGAGGGFSRGQNSSALNSIPSTGGTSYIHPARKDSINVPGVWDGDGRVVIEYSVLGAACDSETITIRVDPSPAKPTFSSTSLQSGSSTLGICQGSNNVNFNVDAIDPSVDYRWAVDPTNVLIRDFNSPNMVISFPNAGNYTITLEAYKSYNGNFCRSESSQIVNVSPNGNFEERAILLKQPGNILIYPDNSMNPINGYQWGYDSLWVVDGDTLSGPPIAVEGQVYQFFTPDSRFLKNERLNTESKAFWVSLRKGDCITRVYYNGPRRARYILNEPETNSVMLKAVPNPNNGNFELLLRGNIYGDMRVQVYNVLGQVISQTTFTKTTSSVVHPLKTDLPDGLYYINLHSSDLKKAQTSFIIQH